MLQRTWIPGFLLLSSGCSPSLDTSGDLPCAVTGDCITDQVGTDDSAPYTGDDTAAPPDDTDLLPGHDSEGTEPDDTGTADTGTEPVEDCEGVSFTKDSGSVSDMSAEFTTGEEVYLVDDGTLSFCPGEWWVHLTVQQADITIQGMGTSPSQVVLSGGESGSVISLEGPLVEVTVTNLTIDRGAALGTGNYSSGGGLRCRDDVEVEITETIFSNNQAYDGAAIFANDGCELSISNSEFVDNETIDDGGAIRMDPGSAAEIENVTFEQNIARDGGAMMLYQADATIRNSRFEDNEASMYAGAIWAYYGTLVIEDTTFDVSTGGMGGALVVLGTTTLENVEFDHSYAQYGGAIYMYSGGSLEGTNCSFSDSVPHDIKTYSGVTYDFGLAVDFTCDASGCEEE